MTSMNILYHKLMDDYQNAPHDTLRWQVIANTAVKEAPKQVMRERLRRRVREAFREAFKEAGYDRDGRVLQRGQPNQKPLRHLRGTLEIHCRGRAGLDCEFGEIVGSARSVVDTVVKSFSQSNEIPGASGQQGEWWDQGIAVHRFTPTEEQRPLM
jgi:hypothetical protein